ncbi:hypothetical protein ABEP16_22300 [Priestia aryabhattai]|uniref:hypothetical protein n=1 Tax=Priestia aryabhattai TaxID=412384 RepID=UPI003D2B41F5
MRYFLKLNVVSILYALLVFIPIEIMSNVYRINRLTTIRFETITILFGALLIVEAIGGTILLFFLIKKWLGDRSANFWTVILWIPYFVLFVYAYAFSFPITYGGDTANPVTILLSIIGLILYPFYILIINFIGITTGDRSSKDA